ncbi:hypothetical protein GCM10018952_00850 [Streptosporangium vulgare]
MGGPSETHETGVSDVRESPPETRDRGHSAARRDARDGALDAPESPPETRDRAFGRTGESPSGPRDGRSGAPGNRPETQERRIPEGCGVRENWSYLATDRVATRWAIADLRLAAWFL